MKYLLLQASDDKMIKFEIIYNNVTLEMTEKDIDDDDYNIYTIDIDSMESLNTFINSVGKIIIKETTDAFDFWWLPTERYIEVSDAFPYTIMIYDTFVE